LANVVAQGRNRWEGRIVFEELPNPDAQPRIARSNDPLPMITLTKPRCPKCKGASLKKYRSISDQGDGSSMSWVKCRNELCGHRFRLLME
jgi:hypothetical protein